jgi:hypothetical protein
MKTIYNKQFYVLEDEFVQVPHSEYNNLIILKDLNIIERTIGLINEIQQSCNLTSFVSLNTSYGGYIPIKCSSNFSNVIISCNDLHYDNIYNNIHAEIQEIKNKITLEKSTDVCINKELTNCLLVYSSSNMIDFDKYINLNPIFLFHKDIEPDSNYGTKFILSNSDLVLYVPEIHINLFKCAFKYYLDEQTNILNYDNLINLCIMVKNGGPQFKDMLTKNLDLIDYWTILDTGSTDETIDIINNLLVDKKKGNLYQEPFINFKDSRNRLLELAGRHCKYTLMLDDTYIIEGKLRDFLNSVRGDQFSDSFTLFIKSHDVEYGSNRILNSDRSLKYLYKIHEVITTKNNINVVIPINVANILDERFDYMEDRTIQRKQLDLKLLQEEIDEDPENPRSYYYMAQTYNILEEHDLAFEYFIKRMNCVDEGFKQEKVDAIFEAARIANFKLNKPWDECEQLYNAAYNLDTSRPDSLYFLGIHHFLENKKKIAYDYFKKAFELGYPIHCQYSLKPTLSYYFLPRYLTQLCYEHSNFELGERSALLFLQNNKPTEEYYNIILDWYNIFVNINKLNKNTTNNFNNIVLRNKTNKPYLIFVADGGFSAWSGSSILKNGVGGSETYIIEMATYIQKHGHYKVIVFCNCDNSEIFNDVEYLHLSNYQDFISNIYVNTCIISRYSEYYPAATLSNIDNIYLIAHDLTFTGNIIPVHNKLKKIFCLSEWHVSYLSNVFPQLKDYLVPFYYGIDFNKFLSDDITIKQKHKFIYSSFPNRGLLELLKMWPKIYDNYNDASLHIFCDLNGEWVNRVATNKITEIKLLIEQYDSKYNIHNHGWVDKKTLANSWITSEYWLYPCTFQETFCLTALEAALTKTLAITNNLAALQNTVGDRGIIIEGDAETNDWQNKALQEVFNIMENPSKKEKLINKNYNWAINLSWENQANKLLNQHLLTNKFQYCGMLNWTNDLPSSKDREIFVNFINYFNQNNKNKHPKVLEVGTYAGVSLIHIISLIPNSIGYGVDKWDDYDEETVVNNLKIKVDILNNINNNNVKRLFEENVKNFGLENRITRLQGDSTNVLLNFIENKEVFDFMYIDGSHKCIDVYNDCVLAWRILRKGGLMALDDYHYGLSDVNNDPLNYPFMGINHFLEKYKKELKIYSKGYRVFIEKN